MISFACPNCQTPYEAADGQAGKGTICLACCHFLTVPAAPPDFPASARFLEEMDVDKRTLPTAPLDFALPTLPTDPAPSSSRGRAVRWSGLAAAFLAFFLVALGCLCGAPLGYFFGRGPTPGGGSTPDSPTAAAAAPAPPAGTNGDKHAEPGDEKPADPKDDCNLETLRAWLRLKRQADAGETELPASAVEHILGSLAALPDLRKEAGDRLAVSTFNEKSVDLIEDWLCKEYKMSRREAAALPLKEAASRLRERP